MRYLLLLTLLLSACSAYVNNVEMGQDAIRDAEDVMEGDLCMPCGNGCIPRELAPVTLCERTTENFSCEFQNNACQRVN